MEYRPILREYSTVFDLLHRLSDVMAVVAGAIVAYFLRFGSFELPVGVIRVVVFAVPITYIVFNWFGVYRSWRGSYLSSELKLVTVAWATVFLLLVAVAFALKVGEQFSRQWVMYWWLVSGAMLVTMRVSLRAALRWLRSEGKNYRRIAIVGAGPLAAFTIRRLQQATWSGLRPTDIYNCGDFAGHDLPLNGLTYHEDCRELANHVVGGSYDQVWICVPLSAESTVREVLDQLADTLIDIRFVPDIFGFRLLSNSITDVAGLPVVNLSTSPLEGVNRWFKEIEDRALALLILLLVSPLMGAIAIGVKLSSPGPIFFRQLRHGWDGRPFKVLKFRTMKAHQEAEGQITQARRNDLRVTRFGAFLRRTSLDELPQFINVLQGHMSIVGPRPHAVAHNDYYRGRVDRYMLRHKVKPGITGWAQINGLRGETETVEKMRRRVEHDLYYIENWSVWLDLKIILLTVLKGLAGKNAY